MAQRKTCGACGGSFECAAPERGCWCEAVKVDPKTLDTLGERFSDCLCPRCLNDIRLRFEAGFPGGGS